MAILEARNVTKDYIDRDLSVRAVDGVSLGIEAGEFSALAGPSGSGKTTLLNLLGTLDSPTEGSVWVDGTNVAELSEGQRSDLRLRKLGFVFQAYNLIPVLSALENVDFVLLLQGMSRAQRAERAEKLLHELGLADLGHKRPTEMSGGQQQRVAVARAIAADPDIVLADEPTANLDSSTAASLLDLMERLNRERNVTFLFSTHDTRVMERARRLVRLVDGRVEKDETRTR